MTPTPRWPGSSTIGDPPPNHDPVRPSEMTPTTGRHPVWAGGPPCDEFCPGSWSQWHEGFAWGLEKGEAAERERHEKYRRALLAELYYAHGYGRDLGQSHSPCRLCSIIDRERLEDMTDAG